MTSKIFHAYAIMKTVVLILYRLMSIHMNGENQERSELKGNFQFLKHLYVFIKIFGRIQEILYSNMTVTISNNFIFSWILNFFNNPIYSSPSSPFRKLHLFYHNHFHTHTAYNSKALFSFFMNFNDDE